MRDRTKEPSRATYDVGDPILKLIRDLPLAVRLEGFGSFKEKARAGNDFEWPWVFKILSGGPITDKISYYFYFLLEQGVVVGLEDAWIQLNSIFKVPFDLQVGQFQVCDPLFKRELRLERSDYDIFKTHVGFSGLNLTYDRGLVMAWHAPLEIEAILQVVNGNGIGPADGDANFDSDKYKNFSFRLARSFGHVRLGAFGYWGKQQGENGLDNQTTYFGPDFVIPIGNKLQISLEYLERRDKDPLFTGNKGDDWVTRGGFAELHYLPKGPDGHWIISLLYNKVDSDDEQAKKENLSVTINHLLARNMRLLIEVRRDIHLKQARLSLGIVTAF